MAYQAGGPAQGPPVEDTTPATPVRPRMRSSAVPMLPRTLVVAVAVGFVAFVAGVQLDPSRSARPSVIVASPAPLASGRTASSDVPSNDAPSETPPAASPGLSDLSGSFDPGGVVLAAGLACSGIGGWGTGGWGGDSRVWTTRCTIPASTRPLAVERLQRAVSAAIGASAFDQEGGFGGTGEPDGPTVRGWNYRSGGFDGSVFLVVSWSGTEVQVMIMLTERFVG